MSRAFIPGAKICGQFYTEAVRPILSSDFPHVKHAAALIGSGSEVLGFDDDVSTDHHWGPRVMLFIEAENQPEAQIIQILSQKLPYEFHGYPTNSTPPDPEDNGTQLLQPITEGPINHRVTVQTIRGFVMDYIGFDIEHTLEPADWLSFSEQHLRTLT